MPEQIEQLELTVEEEKLENIILLKKAKDGTSEIIVPERINPITYSVVDNDSVLVSDCNREDDEINKVKDLIINIIYDYLHQSCVSAGDSGLPNPISYLNRNCKYDQEYRCIFRYDENSVSWGFPPNIDRTIINDQIDSLKDSVGEFVLILTNAGLNKSDLLNNHKNDAYELVDVELFRISFCGDKTQYCKIKPNENLLTDPREILAPIISYVNQNCLSD